MNSAISRAASCYLPRMTAHSSMSVRTKMTKTKKIRLLKKARNAGKPKPKPPLYTPPDQPVIVSHIATRKSLAEPEESEKLTTLLKERSEERQVSPETPPLRHHFTNFLDEMSPKVRQLFSITNANTRELAKLQKEKAIELFQIREGDTGSPASQIVALTSRIQQVQKHSQVHRKDYSGKRGLDALYVKRRKMLDYLERKDFETYRVVVRSLGLVR